MIIAPRNQRGKRPAAPFCQATGCFCPADLYLVLKETEEGPATSSSFSYDEISKSEDGKGYEEKNEQGSPADFDGLKLILYLCGRHANDVSYLVNGSELAVSKRCYLNAPPASCFLP